MKRNYILLCLMITAGFNLFSMETQPEDWIFVKNMPGAKDTNVDDKDVDWRIKGKKLELNPKARETMTQQDFDYLIKESKNDNIPLILIMMQSGENGEYIRFFDVTVLKNMLVNWRKDLDDMKMTGRNEKVRLKDPFNRQEITNMEIYVVGDDGKLRLLKDNVDQNYLENFIKYDGFERDVETRKKDYIYSFEPALVVPGMAQGLIAGLYKKQFQQRYGEERKKKVKIKDLNTKLEHIDELVSKQKKIQKELNLLQKQKRAATSLAESENLSLKINGIQAELNNIMKQNKFLQGALEGTNPQVEKLHQLERLWLTWALDKFPSSFEEKELIQQEISKEIDQIQYDSDYLEYED